MNISAEASDVPQFVNLNDDDLDLVAGVVQARATLPQFKAAFSKLQFAEATYLVKAPFVNRNDIGQQALVGPPDVALDNTTRPIAHLWLTVTSVLEDLIFVSIAEAPPQMRLTKGDSFVIQDQIIEDWMINQNGTVYGGFSLRIMRNRLRTSDRERFDNHTGIREFKEPIA